MKFVQPKIILLASSTAINSVLQANSSFNRKMGKWLECKNGAKVMPIFHPSYLLRNDSRKAGSPKWLVWQNIEEVRKQLDVLLEEENKKHI
ncbi:hypothetical protein GC174_14430 [bacterium]|nr:hypothetical protein [bacterium]